MGDTLSPKSADDVLAAKSSVHSYKVGEADIRAFQQSYAQTIGTVDLVVFSAPQLSLIELRERIQAQRADQPPEGGASVPAGFRRTIASQLSTPRQDERASRSSWCPTTWAARSPPLPSRLTNSVLRAGG